MSYKTYTTEAIVCGSRANNTSDKSYLLFTREAGMLWATAKSVREERSKQRFALQDFSLIRVSLVRGKSGWRVGSAECERNYFTVIDNEAKPARVAVAGIVKLLRQFIHGEGAHTDVFDDTKAALGLAVTGTFDPSHISDIFSLRLLNRLGYISSKEVFADYLGKESWWQLSPLPVAAHAAITRAKQVSHL